MHKNAKNLYKLFIVNELFFLSLRQLLERFLNAQVFLLQGLDDEVVVYRPLHQVGADVGVALRLENPVVAFDALHTAHLWDAVEHGLVDLALELHDDHVACGVVLFQVLDLVVGHHHTFINNNGALADGFHLLHDVGGEEDGFLLAEVRDEVADVDELVGVEAGSRLVEDEHQRVVHHGLGQADTLAVAFRQGTDFLVCLQAEARLVNHRLDAFVGGFAFQLVHACHKLQVFAHVHVQIQRIVLGQVAHDALDGHRIVDDVVSVDARCARGGRDEAGDDFHQRRLACAVGAEQADDTFINRERHVIEGELFAVLLGDMVDFDGHFIWL